MICPTCNSEMENGVCENCRFDDELYSRTMYASFKYYNLALDAANKREITTAIKYLEESLKFNFDNILSCNLLGLCYVELGLYPEAIKHFFLSCFTSNENNIAAHYVETIQNELRENPNLEASYILYNDGLADFKRGEFDEGSRALKRALELNEKLIPAYELLALHYYNQNKTKSAKTIVRYVLETDKSSELSLKIKEEIFIKENVNKPNVVMKTATVPKPTKRRFNPNAEKIKQNENFTMKESGVKRRYAIGFLVGVIIVGLISYFAILPMYQKSAEQSVKAKQKELDEKSKELEEANAKVSELETENAKMEEDLLDVSSDKSKSLLTSAKEKYESKNYEDAAQDLYQITEGSLQGEDYEEYSELKKNVYAETADIYFNRGKLDFKDNDYEGAIASLTWAYTFATDSTNDDKTVSETLYMLGICYTETSEEEKAKSTFKLYLEKYPDGKDAQEVQQKLDALGD